MKGSLFSTTASEDFLNLYENDDLQYNRITKILNFSKNDISQATGVAKSSIRLDERISKELKDRIIEWATLLNLVAEHFDGDPRKTVQWFTTLNPMLGDISPRDMIRLGRFKKLLKFVLNALEENIP